MTVPCVRVAREDGERTRQQLADRDIVDDLHDIVHEDGHLYIPVTDPETVPDEFTLVDREMPERETQTTPDELVPFSPTYERLGNVVITDEDDPERARELADAIVKSDLPAKTVLNRASKVKGEERVREWDLLAGEETEAVHREYGHEFALDLEAVYFSPRLATERHRVVEQVQSNEHVVDMFAGVGPFAVPMASRGATVVGVDINETAVEYLEENAARNGVSERVTAVHGDVRAVAEEYAGWANRLVMNLPHSADDFLDAARTLASDDCVVHYYDITHEDDLYGPGERAIRDTFEPAYAVDILERRTVRSYAPHEYNVVLDVQVHRTADED